MRTSLLLTALLIVTLLPTAASAHAQLDKSSVPAGTTQTLTVTARSERPLDPNSEIEVRVPDGFSNPVCHSKADWSCAVREEGGAQIVHFTRTAGNDILISDSYVFDVVVAPTPGDYVVPIIQTYASGEQVGWTNPDPSADKPAPHLEVTAGGPAVENDEEAPEHSPPGEEPQEAPAEAEQPPAQPAQPEGSSAPAQPAQQAQPASGSSQSPRSSAAPSSSGSSGAGGGSSSAAAPAASSGQAAQPSSPGAAAAAPAATPATTDAGAEESAPTDDQLAQVDTTDTDGTGADDRELGGDLDGEEVPARTTLASGQSLADEDGGSRGGLISLAVLLLAGAGGGLVLARRRRAAAGDA